MCAIYGSRSLEKFKELYELNIQRGDSAYGLVLINNHKKAFILKGAGRCNKLMEMIPSQNSFIYYTGHTQAPTSAAQLFNPKTSHPFICGDWIVSHNGVLTNHEALRERVLKEKVNIVDSSVISALLDEEVEDCRLSEIAAVLSELEGTHSTTIYNRRHKALLIARCGSTLFVDEEGSYSSTEFKGSKEVPDGALLEYSDRRFNHVCTFKSNSPFFIL